MATRKLLSNDGAYGYKYDELRIPVSIDAAFTADVTKSFISPVAGTIVDAVLGLCMGADGTDALTCALDVKINGTTIFTTPPSIAKTAGSGGAYKNTLATATGIVVGVINSAACTVAKGDNIQVVFDITRTTPETEITVPGAYVAIRVDSSTTP